MKKKNIPAINRGFGRVPQSFLLDFSTLPDGTIPSLGGASWSVSGGAAVNTPVGGANLVTNGSMEDGSPPTGWTASSGSSLASVADPRTGSAGTKSIGVTRGTNNTAAFQGVPATLLTGGWYALTGWEKNVSATNVQVYTADAILAPVASTDAAWAAFVATKRYTSDVTPTLRLSVGVSGEGRFDDIVINLLTLSGLFATRRAETADIVVQATITRKAATQPGLVLCLDSQAAPANFVVAYLDAGTTANLVKCVGGTYTSVISAAVTYAAGAILKVVRVGNDFSLYYNGLQVGTTQAITDAGIINNRYVGLFSTDAGNQFASFAYYLPASRHNIMPYGDSKTVGLGDVVDAMAVLPNITFFESPLRIAVSGRTVALAQDNVVAELAAASGTPEYILWNLGANDVQGVMPSEAAWKADAQDIVDKMHTKWPGAKIYFMRPWVRAETTDCNTIAGWYADLVAVNPGVCFLGPDERVFLEGGDDGATWTADGVHPTPAGYTLTATKWRESIGL